MKSSCNTPPFRTTRSNSQNEVTLDNIKILLEASKKEIIKSFKVEIQTLREAVSSLTSRVDSLEEENRSLRKNYQELAKQSSMYGSTSGVSGMPLETNDQIESAMYEFQQRYEKRRNIVISGLPEHEVTSASDCQEIDSGAVQDIFREMGLDNIKIREVCRLGRTIPGRSRLLKVKCADTVSRNEVLRKSYVLRNSEKYKKVYINKDLTIAEQRRNKQLRDELNRRRGDGELVVIRKGKIVNIEENVGSKEAKTHCDSRK